MIFGGNKFLRRIISLAAAAAMLVCMIPALSSCGSRKKITVWVYSDEYRRELEDFLRSTPLDLSFDANIRAVSSTEFESAGINQTRHKIYLSLRTTVRLVIPSGARQVSLGSQVLIAESIIVGEVPQSYVQVPEMSDALNFAVP